MAELLISSFGDYEHNDGGRIYVSGPDIIFEAAIDGTEVKVGVPILFLLDCIAQYTHQHES